MLVADVAGARSRLMPGTRTVTVTELNHGSVPGSKVRCGEEDGVGNDRDNQNGQEGGTGLVAEQAKVKPQKPPLYKVLLLNDDYTPMEFVVLLLMKFFSMTQEQAEQIMIHVHTKGVGVCGVFPREIAETKVRLVLDFASENQHPLQCTLEKE